MDQKMQVLYFYQNIIPLPVSVPICCNVQVNRWLSLKTVISSVPGDFTHIYHQFIQRKGASGYLASTMKEAA